MRTESFGESTPTRQFIAPNLLRRTQYIFWCIYLFFPIVTGILQYRFIPNEYFDEVRHNLLASHEVCDDWGRCGNKNDAWADKRTGRIFTPEDFVEHRKSESIRMASADMWYALIGCFMFAYLNATRGDGSFFRILGQAVCVALAFITIMQFVTYFS